MKIFIHLAVDHFGAECLGKFSRIQGNIAEENKEQHIYVWAGVNSPPLTETFWSDSYPKWESEYRGVKGVYPLEMPYSEDKHGRPDDFSLDRKSLATDICGMFRQEAFRHRMQWLYYDKPQQIVGPNGTHEVFFTISGSLADPAGSAIIIGLLSVFSHLRKIGVFNFPVYLMVGTGFLSGPFREQEEKVRALVARGLLDIESHFAGASNLSHSAVPTYVVGEEPIDKMPSDRPSQVAAIAGTLLGMSRSATAEDREKTAAFGRFDPFYFYVDTDQKVHFADREFIPGKPFSAVGVYMVQAPFSRLARLLASRACQDVMASLSDQASETSIEDCSKIVPPEPIQSFLSDLERRVVSLIWESVSEKTNIPWEGTKEGEEPSWFDLGYVKLLYQPIFGNKDWDHFLKNYTVDRLLALPLEDWEGAINELFQAVEEGYIPKRRQAIMFVTHRLANAFLDGLDRAASEIFQGSFDEPVGLEPHRTAQAFLGMVYRELQDKIEELERLGLFLRKGDGEVSPRRKLLKKRRDTLGKEIESIPSPAAVFLRLAPIGLLCSVAIMALPFDLGILDPLRMRFLAGILLGLISAGTLFIRHVGALKQRLLKGFSEWFTLYRTVLDEEDGIRQGNAYAQLLRTMRDCTAWYYTGKEEKPPMPDAFGIHLQRQEGDVRKENPADIMRRQTVLSSFKEYLQRAANSFSSLKEDLLNRFQSSHLETIMPEITIRDVGRFDEEYGKIFGEEGEKVSKRSLQGFMRMVRDWTERALPENNVRFVFPFSERHSEEKVSEVNNLIWRRDFCLPGGEALLDENVRLDSSAYQFFETIRRYIIAQYGDSFILTTLLEEYFKKQKQTTMNDTPLYERYLNLSCISVAAEGEATTDCVIAAAEDDRLAAAYGRQNGFGKKNVSARLQVKSFLSAKDIIFYPNETSPVNPLGKAWKNFLESPLADKAFEPARISEEERSW